MEQELHSFPYEAEIAGQEHAYRITQNGDTYGIEQDGVVIAEIKPSPQVSGEPLSKELVDSICQHIEAHEN